MVVLPKDTYIRHHQVRLNTVITLTTNIIINIIIKIGGSTWTKTSAPSGNWQSITSDSTGKYLTAGQYNGYIFVVD